MNNVIVIRANKTGIHQWYTLYDAVHSTIVLFRIEFVELNKHYSTRTALS